MLDIRRITVAAAYVIWAQVAAAQPSPTERKVVAPTRLDWAFAVQGFGPGADKLPAGFDSAKQRYQLFVPKQYKPGRASPLVLFISAGDQPAGWEAWKTICDKEGIFFASPVAAGNGVASGPRTRIVVDVLDDIRRAYRGHAPAEPAAGLRAHPPRRRADARAHPDPAAAPADAPAGAELARRLVTAGQVALKQPETTWRGVALLQAAAQRGGSSEPGKTA